jgi:SAM-dependent methyltransferase
MVCHGELYRLRPDPRHLTAFYLTIAVGGALGGLFVAVIAPAVFPGFWEVPLGLLFCLLLFLAMIHGDPDSSLSAGHRPAIWSWIAVGVGLVGPMMMAVPLLSMWNNDVQVRTFYGVHRVADRDVGTPKARRVLRHGITLHGAQFLSEEGRRLAISYYGPGSGAQIAIDHHPRRLAGETIEVGGVGLGAGSVAAYAREGDRYRFYELDPMVPVFAQRYFTYLEDTPASVNIVLGDGRISLEREFADSLGTMDVMVVDAFAGGSIPVHLLTRECFEIYWRALKPDGVLVFHVSNRYLDLAPLVRGAAHALGKEAVQMFSKTDKEKGLEESHWVLVTSNAELLAGPGLGDAVTPWAEKDELLLWTDRRTSLLQVLR